jgi:hypothetical protein
MNEEGKLSFGIDRNNPNCATPCRNPNILQLLNQCGKLYKWLNNVVDYIIGVIPDFDRVEKAISPNINIHAFVPVLPVLIDRSVSASAEQSPVLGIKDLLELLNSHKDSLHNILSSASGQNSFRLFSFGARIHEFSGYIV